MAYAQVFFAKDSDLLYSLCNFETNCPGIYKIFNVKINTKITSII